MYIYNWPLVICPMCLLHFCLCQPVCGLLARRPALLAVLFCQLFLAFFAVLVVWVQCWARCGDGVQRQSRSATRARIRHAVPPLSLSIPIPLSLYLFVPLLSPSPSFPSLSLAHSAQIAIVGKATVADQKPSACGMPHAVQPLPLLLLLLLVFHHIEQRSSKKQKQQSRSKATGNRQQSAASSLRKSFVLPHRFSFFMAIFSCHSISKRFSKFTFFISIPKCCTKS